MSDQSQGPGWWLASDGKWYPPESAPTLTAPPPPGFPAAGYPRPGSTNGFAIVSMVLGILWLYTVGSILALVFGYKARKEIDQSGGAQQGRGMATAGIVLGWIGVIGTALLVLSIVVLAALGEEAEQSFERTGEAIEGVGGPSPDPNDDGISETTSPARPAGVAIVEVTGATPCSIGSTTSARTGTSLPATSSTWTAPLALSTKILVTRCGDRNEPSGFCVDLYEE